MESEDGIARIVFPPNSLLEPTYVTINPRCQRKMGHLQHPKLGCRGAADYRLSFHASILSTNFEPENLATSPTQALQQSSLHTRKNTHQSKRSIHNFSLGWTPVGNPSVEQSIHVMGRFQQLCVRFRTVCRNKRTCRGSGPENELSRN